MNDNKKSERPKRNIIELGYRPTGKADTSNPPKGGSIVRGRPHQKPKTDKSSDD